MTWRQGIGVWMLAIAAGAVFGVVAARVNDPVLVAFGGVSAVLITCWVILGVQLASGQW